MTTLSHQTRSTMKKSLSQHLGEKYNFKYFVTLSPSVDASKQQINRAMKTFISMLNEKSGVKRKRNSPSYKPGHIKGIAVLEKNTAGRYHIHILIDSQCRLSKRAERDVERILHDSIARLVIGQSRKPLFARAACNIQRLHKKSDVQTVTDYCLKSFNRPSSIGTDFFTYIDAQGFMSFC